MTVWYTKQPLRRNTLQKMTKTIFEKAVISRPVTNHSLRASGTTHLFSSGVPEKIIKERTGHTSLDALRCYERTTEGQIQAVSTILAPQAGKLSFLESLEQQNKEKKHACNSSEEVKGKKIRSSISSKGAKSP